MECVCVSVARTSARDEPDAARELEAAQAGTATQTTHVSRDDELRL